MVPIIHCVRHAQGYHNLSTANHSLPDPLLTSLGEQQCHDLSAIFPYHSNIELLVTSPLRRTIYTTLYSFPEAVEKGVKVVALPEAQETSDVPCDTGSDAGVLKSEMGGKGVELGLVGYGWNSKKDKWAPTAAAIAARARETRRWLKARPEKEIVLVTHGGFLHYFTEDWTDSNLYQAIKENRVDDVIWDMPGTGWRNTEFRSYQFADASDGSNDSLLETSESRERRGKTEASPTSRTKQRELFKSAMQQWEDSGLQNPMKVGESRL